MGVRGADAGHFRVDGDSTRRALCACVVGYAESQTYVIERTARNDHPQINAYFRALGYSNPERMRWVDKMWCAAFVSNCYRSCGVTLPMKGALAAVSTWRGAKRFHVPKADAGPADAVVYTWGSHIELVKDWHPNPKFPFYTAIGGNTGDPKNRKRHGVFVKTRQKIEVRTVIRIIKKA